MGRNLPWQNVRCAGSELRNDEREHDLWLRVAPSLPALGSGLCSGGGKGKVGVLYRGEHIGV